MANIIFSFIPALLFLSAVIIIVVMIKKGVFLSDFRAPELNIHAVVASKDEHIRSDMTVFLKETKESSALREADILHSSEKNKYPHSGKAFRRRHHRLEVRICS